MESRMLGDYRLIEQLAEHPTQSTWLAEQASVGRKVVVVELTDLSVRESFLESVRAKAAIDQPLIGSIYEAVSDDEVCFVAFERLDGTSLGERMEAGETLEPAVLANVMRRTAEAMLYFRNRGLATEPLTPEAVHVNDHGVVRIENLALAGEPDPESEGDVPRLGMALPALVEEGKPAASRVRTVAAWMCGEGLEQPLSWEEVREYGEQIESQLDEADSSTHLLESRKSPVPVIVGVAALLALIGAVMLFMKPEPVIEPPPVPAEIPLPVEVPGGDYPAADGSTVVLDPFEISACEVTIGEYRDFLRVLGHLEPHERAVFDADGQPESKQGHEPEDWEAMLAAAVDEGEWQGRPMNLMCPVVGVDWWDAMAYCDWKRGRLPTQDEWVAALSAGGGDEPPKPAGWGPVTMIPASDRTANGLRGMAGSVAEWTLEPVVNPANPLGERRHVIVGASFLQKSGGVQAREWTDERDLRRDDLGFRIVFDK